MQRKMIWKDICKNKAVTITICLFITLATMLVAGAFCIIADIKQSMDSFFQKAVPLHYMQMVSGEIDQQKIDRFSHNNPLVADQQTLELLGVDNSNLFYADSPEPYIDSVMENNFVTQSPYFDFLLDENNQIIEMKPGQVAVPLYAVKAYGLDIGDKILVKDRDFTMQLTVACFVRDSQMNPSLVSSKRFVVNEEDYQTLKSGIGEVEYLIEFRLVDPSKSGEFEAAYLAADLPSGIAIALPILQLMNAMTVGLTAIVLILASILLIVIALICMKYIITASIEEEYREIGIMKAIGLNDQQVHRLYMDKYAILSLLSCGIGFLLSLGFSRLFTRSVYLYMGKTPLSVWNILLPLAGAFLVFIILMAFCWLMLRQLRQVSAVNAIRGIPENNIGKRMAIPIHKVNFPNINILLGLRDIVNRARNYYMPVFVFALCTFLFIVPVNFLYTLKAPSFVEYTGIGNCDVLITLRHSDHMNSRYIDMLDTLENDVDVESYAEHITANYKIQTFDGGIENISVILGDFTSFPIPYLYGRNPVNGNEIALSLLNAQGYQKSIGDTVRLLIDGKPLDLKVCGIYQDLTNGGKSAQALLPYKEKDVLWYAVLLTVTDKVNIKAKITQWNQDFSPVKVAALHEYMSQTFSSTIQQFQNVTWAIVIISTALMVLITALFFKMLLAKDKQQVNILKGLGFTSANIQSQYITSSACCLVLGIFLGNIAAKTLGEKIVGLLMGTMGASKISLITNTLVVFFVCPALLSAAVLIATYLSVHAVRKSAKTIRSE